MASRHGRVRIRDIADELRMSTATVSNVIHGKTKKISDETVRVVQRKLEERQYLPGVAAELLGQNDSRIVGVVVHDHPKYGGLALQDPFISSALNFLSGEIEASGHYMLLKKASCVMDAARFASMWNMVGMAVLGFCADEYQQLRDHIRVPLVVYDGFFENRGRICNVMIDDYDGGRQVGAHFRALGHARALCLADNRICMDAERVRGFAEGFGSGAGFWQIPMEGHERHRFYGSRLDALRGYTAVFAVSDYYALDVMRFLQRQGVRVPHDISVAGFDDGPLCTLALPSLTSVRQDGAARARAAISFLLRMKEDPSFSETRVLPVHLVARESTARPSLR